MDDFFKPEDFAVCWCAPENSHKEMDVVLAKTIAERANALLKERGVEVYGFPNNSKDMYYGTWGTLHHPKDTHRALLVGIEKLEGK